MARVLLLATTFALVVIAPLARDTLPRGQASAFEALAATSCGVAVPDATAPGASQVLERRCGRLSWDLEGGAAGGGDASISGTVTEEGSAMPIANACVFVIQRKSGLVPAFARTDGAGAYTAGGLAPGSYRVAFNDCNPGGFHVPEYYDDEQNYDDADTVTLASGESVEDIDAALAPGGGAIGGTVREEGTSTPIEGICVYVYDTGSVETGGVTDASGQYTVGGLPTGDYYVLFDSCTSPEYYNYEWYNNAPDEDSSDLVHVRTAGTTRGGVNGSLAVGGAITGQVTEAGSGDVLPNVCVFSYDDAGFGDSDITDASGHYELGGVPAGNYKLFFADCQVAQTHAGQWYDRATGHDTALEVNVSRLHTTSGVDAVMESGGQISGRVTEQGTGDALPDMCVTAYSISENSLGGFGSTDDDGRYQLAVTPSSSYSVYFSDCSTQPDYNSEYYNDRRSYFESSHVRVGSVGTKTSAINGSLLRRLAGDADCSRHVDAVDVTFILQYVALLLFELPCDVSADVNRDGDWTPVDATLVLQYEAGLLHSLPN